MGNDIRVGRLFGIEIFISYSWFFIFALVTVSLAFGLFPRDFPEHNGGVNFLLGVIASAFFFASLLFHEFSHSLVANLNNIPIRKITLFIFGGMSQMTEEPGDPSSEFKMAIAGPLSSFLLAGIFYSIFNIMTTLEFPSPYYAAFGWLAQINFLLAVFNLAPGFPLDGGRVLRAGVWYYTKNLEGATNIAAKVGQGVAFLIISFGALLLIFGQLGGIWLMLIGWFLNQSAVSSFQQVMLQHSLSNVDVENIMSTEVLTVAPGTTLDQLVNKFFLRYRYGRFPVVDDDKLLGIVTLHDVKEIDRENWANVTAGDIIEPISEDLVIAPDAPAIRALAKMVGENAGHLMVIDQNGKLSGIVTKTDVIKLIEIKGELDV